MKTRLALIIPAGLIAASPAVAQFDLSWNTIDGGGGTSSAGTFALAMTIGQPDAGSMSGGAFVLSGGFWAAGAGPASCYANCDGSTTPPVLNVADFSCFLNRFAAGDSYANCDHSTTAPILNALDFSCFLNAFAAGCS